MKGEKCVLYEKLCDECGECNMCDLDPKKVCDSCGKCIESGDDYNIIDVDLSFEDGGEVEELSFEEMFPDDVRTLGDFDDEDDEELDDFEDFDDYEEYEDDVDEDGLRRDFGELF